jgi:hypothetical protein
LEIEQAKLLAAHYVQFWSQLNVSLETGLMTELNAEAYFKGARNALREYPGLLPYIAGNLTSTGLVPGGFSRIFDVAWEELEKAGYSP